MAGRDLSPLALWLLPGLLVGCLDAAGLYFQEGQSCYKPLPRNLPGVR